MTSELLHSLREWFSRYVATFDDLPDHDRRNTALKEAHTAEVCANMRLIAEGLLDDERRLTAEAVALFHDVGRFEQYRRFRTFRDADSVNHAALGVEILEREGVLASLPDGERELIVTAIRFHNVFSLPRGLKGDRLLFTQLIRDADKLDIWRVFAEFYALPEEERASAVGLGFPDLPGYTPGVLAALKQGRLVELSSLKVLNDFKLLQLSWIYDLNFPASFRLVEERGLVECLAAALPQDSAVVEALGEVRRHLCNRARNAR